MSEPRFRFRIPWLGSAPGAPRPPPRPQPPPTQPPQPEPAQPVSAPPAAPQLSPFRPPAGMASPPPARGGFQLRLPHRPASDSGTISQPTSPPQSPPRPRLTSLSPPASPGRTAPPSPPPTRLPPVAPSPPPPPPPSSPPPPPPYQPSIGKSTPQRKMESASLTKEPSPSMTAKLRAPAPSEKVVPEIPRVVHPTHQHEHGKDMEQEIRGKKLEKGKVQKVPKHHHHEVAMEEKKKAMPSSSSYGKCRVKPHHHHFHAPAGEEPSLQKGIKEDVTKLVQKLTAGHPMKQQAGEHPVHVITLAGENRGASMQLSSESDLGQGSIHIHRGYKTNPDESIEQTTDGEQAPDLGEEAAIPFSEDDEAPEAYINSNVQALNNSIIFEGSVTEENPGVHIVMSVEDEAKLPQLPTDQWGGKEELPETRRSEFSPTPSQRLMYQPIIKRRCLRGLLMESSDSDLDDPEKPRRHGCRYGCILEKSKDDKDVNVL